jgi:curved DNA-binding protein CbpA
MDYYNILSLKYNFSNSEIRKNYIELAKYFHPDRFKGSTEIFKRISDAYHTLKDEKKREDYNRKLKIKIYKKQKDGFEGFNNNNNNKQEEERTTSKYEEEFNKFNMEKFYYKFSRKNIKTSHLEIKVK